MLPVARGFEFKLTAEADNVAIVRRALHSLLHQIPLRCPTHHCQSD